MAFDFGFEKMVKILRPEKKIESESSLKGGKFAKDVVPSFMDGCDISTKTITESAKKACEFFGLPNIPIKEGPAIGVAPGNPMTFKDDYFIYNKGQLKRAGLDNSVDIAKVYSHECGHRIAQRYFGGKNSWANELCADFFVGARNEMLGLKPSNMEKFLGKQRASFSHPGGKMRLQAIEYGRKCVAELKKKGETPTWEKLMAKFKETNAEKVSFMNYKLPEIRTVFSSDIMGLSSTYHLDRADYYKRQNAWKTKEIQHRIKTGNLKGAKDLSISAKYDVKHMNEHISDAKRALKKGK